MKNEHRTMKPRAIACQLLSIPYSDRKSQLMNMKKYAPALYPAVIDEITALREKARSAGS